MLRWFASVTLLCVLAFTAGCGGTKEVPPKTDAKEPTMSSQDSMKKAMEGMPPEMRAKTLGKRVNK